MDTSLDLTLVIYCSPSHRLYDSSRSEAGLVHCDVRVGDLPPEPVACIPDAEDRSRHVRDRGRGRRRNGVAHKTVRRVPSIHQEAARVQVLVLSDEGHGGRVRLHLLRVLQHPGLLANPRHVLHHTLLHHDETTDQAHDAISLHPLHVRQTEVPRQGKLIAHRRRQEVINVMMTQQFFCCKYLQELLFDSYECLWKKENVNERTIKKIF
jgi:hypothetical protein